MLIRIDHYKDIDGRKLMDVYGESNAENAEEFFPDDDPEEGSKKVEAGFLEFLRDDFFTRPGNVYYVLEVGGVWVSALRLNLIEEGFYYLEALETHPACRRKGYAVELIEAVKKELENNGDYKICDCVDKRNIPSVNTHLRAGFVIAADEGRDYLCNEVKDHEYSFEYCFKNP